MIKPGIYNMEDMLALRKELGVNDLGTEPTKNYVPIVESPCLYNEAEEIYRKYDMQHEWAKDLTMNSAMDTYYYSYQKQEYEFTFSSMEYKEEFIMLCSSIGLRPRTSGNICKVIALEIVYNGILKPWYEEAVDLESVTHQTLNTH